MIQLQIDRSSPVLTFDCADLDRSHLAHYLSAMNSAVNTQDRSMIPIIFRHAATGSIEKPDASNFFDFPGNYYAQVHSIDETLSVSTKGTHRIRATFDGSASGLPSRVEIDTDGSVSDVSLVLRVFREIQYTVLAQRGYVLIHASATCESDGSVTAFLGDKGAGKSAWLLRSLAQGRSLIANDRIFVHPETLDVRPFSIAALISRPSLKNLPSGLRADISAGRIQRRDHLIPGYEKVGLTPLELANAFGVFLAGRGKLQSINVLKCVSSPLQTDEALAILQRNIYMPVDPTYSFGLLTRAAVSPLNAAALSTALWSSHVARPWPFTWPEFDLWQGAI